MQINEEKRKVFSEKDKPLLLALFVVLLSLSAKIFVKLTDLKTENLYVSLCVVQLVIFVMPTVFYCMMKKDSGFALCGIKAVSVRYIPVIAASAVLMFFLTIALKYASVYLLDLKDSSLTGFMNAGSLTYALIAGVIAPMITEEILLRGVFFSELKKITSGAGTIIISALMFAILHFSVANFLVYFGAGIILGVVTYITNSVIPAIILHGVNNFTALFTENTVINYANENVGGAFALMILCSITLLLVILWLYMLEKLFLKKALSEPEEKSDNIKINIFKIIISPIFLITLAIFPIAVIFG